jgi:hypothetical protein
LAFTLTELIPLSLRQSPQRQLLLCTGDNYFCATSVFKQ